MARRRKKSKGAGISFTLSDGVKHSILAIALITAGVLFMLSFFDLAGVVGMHTDQILTAVFGWDRWLFAVVLFALGWSVAFPERSLVSAVNLVGLGLFFLAFNGLLNLLLIAPDADIATEILLAGGYIGLPVSAFLVSLFGFWGSFVVAFAILMVSVFLVFNLSFRSILTVHEHFSSLGAVMHDNKKKSRARIADRLDEAEDDEDDEAEEEEEAIEEEEGQVAVKPKRKLTAAALTLSGSEENIESVMTTTSRRRMEIPTDLLDDKVVEAKSGDIDRSREIIENTFEDFGIEVEMVDVRVGPSVTQYALRPAHGVKLSRIVALQNDLALALAAHPIRIEAPIPGKSLVGIEVPNITVGSVSLREMLESKGFKRRKSNLCAPLGKDVSGNVDFLQVDKAPHTLVAGATGSGKSVCLNVIIASLLYQNGPDELKLIMVDPKRVELGIYAGIPHLLIPPITKAEEAINALKWGVREMERRLDHLAKFGARDIDAYNAKSEERMPKIVFIIDELADLMGQSKRDVEALIVRIAQMARAAGIHLILATQRPSVDVITGTIKANIPTRLAFAVASQVDSKTILDISGAEKLLGRGDMLLSTPQLSKPKRLQGAYVSDGEIERIVQFLTKHGEPDYNYQITEDTRTGGTLFESNDSDPLFDDAVKFVLESGKASTSYLQRRMRVGYSRAARIMDLLEQNGIIGPGNGAKPREVLISEWPPASEQGEIEFEETPSNDTFDDMPPEDDFDDDEDEEDEDET